MTFKGLPIASFLAARGSNEIGQYYGIDFGAGILTTDFGGYLFVDTAPPPATFPVSDAVFAVFAAGDLTKTWRADVSGQAPGTATTIFCTGTVAQAFRLPDLSGTALVAQDATGIVFVGRTVPDQGSGAGYQYCTLTSGRASARYAQYGANAGVPGPSGFKSRGLTLGALASVAPGDTLVRLTGTGVTGDNASVPLGGYISLDVPADGVFAQSISPDWIFQLAKTTINSRRDTWRIRGLTGDLIMSQIGERILLKEGANAMQGVAVLGAGGLIVVPNTLITATTRVMFSIQEGAAPLGTIYCSARAVGASFTLQSNNAADTCTVAWQLWEPAP